MMGLTYLLAIITICQSLARGRIINSNMHKDSSCGHFIPSGANIVGGRYAGKGEVPWQLISEFQVNEE